MNESIHIYTAGIPNPSAEMEEKRKEAEAIYDGEVKKNLREVWLLYSRHPYSEGYWIEFTEPKELHGFIIKHFIPDL